ncbi:MAG TPA: permease prefix domain 1-containing protein [Kofleriaceae bacterium]|jgi:plasmid stabilization system protein ParE
MRDETEVAIAQYRSHVVAEAELARGDLDEIEDHLRELADELRATGMPRAQAIAEACRRLGDPRELAREHSRVHTPFGARLSRMRAISAVVLFGIPLALWARQALFVPGQLASPVGVDFVLTVATLAALIFRRSWARPLVLGSLAIATCYGAADVLFWPTRMAALDLVCVGGALAFVFPWRRGELTRGGLALALLAPAYVGALHALELTWRVPANLFASNPLGLTAIALAFATAAGLVLRARWAAFAAGGLAWTLAMFLRELRPMLAGGHPLDGRGVEFLSGIALGVGCAAIVAVLAWRSAPSFRGTWRHVLG